jgi:hypothetical protein
MKRFILAGLLGGVLAFSACEYDAEEEQGPGDDIGIGGAGDEGIFEEEEGLFEGEPLNEEQPGPDTEGEVFDPDEGL